ECCVPATIGLFHASHEDGSRISGHRVQLLWLRVPSSVRSLHDASRYRATSSRCREAPDAGTLAGSMVDAPVLYRLERHATSTAQSWLVRPGAASGGRTRRRPIHRTSSW